MMQNQTGSNPLPQAMVPQNPAPANPGKNLTAKRKKQIAAQIRQASF
jgi:hypothetical protein